MSNVLSHDRHVLTLRAILVAVCLLLGTQVSADAGAKAADDAKPKPAVKNAGKRWGQHLRTAVDETTPGAFPPGTTIVVEDNAGVLTENAIVRLVKGKKTLAAATIGTSAWEACAGASCVACSYLGCPFVMFPVLSFAYLLFTPEEVLMKQQLPLVDGGGQSRVTNAEEACTAGTCMSLSVCLIPIAPSCGPAGLKVLGPTVISPFLMSTATLRHWRRRAAARSAIDEVMTSTERSSAAATTPQAF